MSASKEIAQKIRSLIKEPKYRPLNKSEFARELSIAPKDRVVLRRVLSDFVDEGKLEFGKKSRYYRPGAMSGDSRNHIGTIIFSGRDRRRTADFVPDDPASVPGLVKAGVDRVHLPSKLRSTAIHGDRVSVKISHKNAPRRRQNQRQKGRYRSDSDDESRLIAQVVEIVDRQVGSFVGTLHKRGSTAAIEPEDKRLPPSFHLKGVDKEARSGDLILAEFVTWTSAEREPLARMTELLGPEDAPGVDMLTVIHRHSLPLKFPAEVLAETELIDETISEEEIARREDWREREVFTIDPEDARDFDDAISVQKLPANQGWELAVHIADVSHYVKPDSAIDIEARKRGNSVYLADRVIPMIPEKLSNGVCSLNPHVERLAHAAVMTFDAKGALQSRRFVSTVIKSCRRYTYEEALTRLRLSAQAATEFEDPLERSVVAHMRRAWELASILRKRRFQDGCFDFDFPEIRVVLDEQNIAFAVKKTEHDESHRLVEEFMLAANEAVAKETRQAPAPSIYRVHEDPDFDKLQEFAELARTFGHKIGDPTIRKEIQKLTKSIKGKPEEQSLKLALLKSMKRAAYSPEPVGHFGLAKSDYSHFTSPIRRYADLIVHRSLKKVMSRRGEPTAPKLPDKVPSVAGMVDVSTHISRTERIAADAERDSQQLKMIEYLESILGDQPDQTFEAMVTDVRPMGIMIELKELSVRGMIRKVDLPSRQAYYFDRRRNKFISAVAKKKSIGISDTIKVNLVRIDKKKGFLDFTPVS